MRATSVILSSRWAALNNVSNNFSGKLEVDGKSGKTLSDGKSINRGKHRLGLEARAIL